MPKKLDTVLRSAEMFSDSHKTLYLYVLYSVENPSHK